MKEGTGSKFIVGFLFGVMIGALIWYWQKSTSAEDGALALLDRLAAAEARLRELKTKQSGEAPDAAGVEMPPADIDEPIVATARDDLQVVKGIGPVFEQRLHQADICTLRQLSGTDAEELAQILGVSNARVEPILGDARRRL